MKIKVDKEEYTELLERVAALEKKTAEDREHIFENWRWTRDSLYKMMEEYFRHKCITAIVKRDKEQIIGELKTQALDNMFKEEA